MTTTAKVAMMRAIQKEIVALTVQQEALQAQFDALEPTLEEWIASMIGEWRGPWAHYQREGDILHVFLEPDAAVSIWREDRVHVNVAHDNRHKVVGITIMGFRQWAREQLGKEKP